MEKSFSSKIGVLLAAAGSAGMVKDPMSVSRIIRGIPVYYLPPDESEEGLSSLLQAVKTRFTQMVTNQKSCGERCGKLMIT